MINVILTTSCPSGCPWCFAEPHLKQYRLNGVSELAWVDLIRLIDFSEKSGIKTISLLGGEPTLHSRFLDILKLLLSRGFRIQVGSCGICSPELVDQIAALGNVPIFFGFNSTRMNEYPDPVKQKVDYFLTHISNLSGISFTITPRDIKAESMIPILDRLQLLKTYSIRPHITFQIAVPCGGNNEYITFQQYPRLMRFFLDCVQILSKNNVSYNLDCHCIPMCAIAEPETMPFRIRSKCSRFPIDIGPNLDCWPCFPFADLHTNLNKFNQLEEVRDYFAAQALFSDLFYEPECSDCPGKKENKCDCGCRGFQHLRQKA